ncbi:hypothetical protein EYF80_010562 [Liparis tanakae]|uniref:Uncharacterized protein n=1 Tax=Liparis tanakae TaxID=230148 RepID=A0A4Z2INH1_9TELE|nr:hypothetical protein EYF80_010562 [Liparis tanakae]
MAVDTRRYIIRHTGLVEVSTVTSELQDGKKREKKKKKKKLCLADNLSVIKVSVATGDMD